MSSQILTYRELALREAITELGVHEVGFNNRGPQVDAYQREGAAYVGWVGFAWCAAFAFRNFARAGFRVERIPNRASVGYAEAYARSQRWLAAKPMRGDLVSFQFDGDTWPDHIGHVERVLKAPFGFVYLQTIEGNTSSGTGGSQADGGGVYRRRRLIRRNKVTFTRVPGRPKRNPDWFLRALTGREAWIEWYLGIGRFEGWERRADYVRPNVKRRVPRAWWLALARRRKKEGVK